MRPAEDIKRLINNAKVRIDQDVKQANLDKLINELEKTKNIPSVDVPPSIWRTIMKSPITKYSAAAIVFVAVMMGLNIIPGNSNQLFANVMDSVMEANSVRYKWTVQADSRKGEYTSMINELCVKRTLIPGGDIQLHDFKTGSHLHLFAGGPGGKACYAELTRRIGNNQAEHPFAYLDWISKIHKIDAEYNGVEEFEGAEYKLYTRKFPYEETNIWVDPQTDLPFRIVIESYPNQSNKNVKPTNLVLREEDFGGKGDYTFSITGRYGGKNHGIQNRRTQIYSDFEWNVELDDSLFSMEAPENYTVKETKVAVASEKYRNWIIEAFAFWTEMSDGKFPDDIRDMVSQEKVVPLIIKKFDKNGDPREEMDRAIEQMRVMVNGINPVMKLIAEDNWTYQGQGIYFGASDIPICWWKNGNQNSPYAIIYGDLSMVLCDNPPQ